MRLIAIKDAQAGDVVYLHPEHKKYSYEHMGIVQYKPSALAVVLTADAAVCITDLDRCVEVVSRRLLARCAGITERRIDEACREAKAGTLMSLQGLDSEPQAQEAAAQAMPEAEHDLSPLESKVTQAWMPKP